MKKECYQKIFRMKKHLSNKEVFTLKEYLLRIARLLIFDFAKINTTILNFILKKTKECVIIIILTKSNVHFMEGHR